MESFCDAGQRLINRKAASEWGEPNVLVTMWCRAVQDHFQACEVCDKYSRRLLRTPISDVRLCP